MMSSFLFYESLFSLLFQLFQEMLNVFISKVFLTFLGQIYHFEITYYIYQSFLAPYCYQLFMNKLENQTYAKLEKNVRIGYS